MVPAISVWLTSLAWLSGAGAAVTDDGGAHHLQAGQDRREARALPPTMIDRVPSRRADVAAGHRCVQAVHAEVGGGGLRSSTASVGSLVVMSTRTAPATPASVPSAPKVHGANVVGEPDHREDDVAVRCDPVGVSVHTAPRERAGPPWLGSWWPTTSWPASSRCAHTLVPMTPVPIQPTRVLRSDMAPMIPRR